MHLYLVKYAKLPNKPGVQITVYLGGTKTIKINKRV